MAQLDETLTFQQLETLVRMFQAVKDLGIASRAHDLSKPADRIVHILRSLKLKVDTSDPQTKEMAVLCQKLMQDLAARYGPR